VLRLEDAPFYEPTDFETPKWVEKMPTDQRMKLAYYASMYGYKLNL